jgi:hypothetical protein
LEGLYVHMLKKSTILTGFILLAGLQFPVRADETYTYTGTAFQSATAPYTTSEFVSGFFTIPSALGDNLANEGITPTSYSFTDGVQTFSNASPPPDVTFDISTDGSGTIDGWLINLESGFNQVATSTQEDFGTSSGGEGLVFLDEGTWQASGGGASPVPEPGNLGLIGLGLAAIVAARRKLQRSKA